MSFDLYGVQPTERVGKEFSRSAWSWRPLWEFVCTWSADILDLNDFRCGNYNSFYRIGPEKAKAIGNRIHDLIDSGDAERYICERERRIAGLPSVNCITCGGKGIRDAAFARAWGSRVCGGCNGSGQQLHPESKYPLRLEDIRSFADFALTSGGFEIG